MIYLTLYMMLCSFAAGAAFEAEKLRPVRAAVISFTCAPLILILAVIAFTGTRLNRKK